MASAILAPGPGGRAELLADRLQEGVALALLMRVELGGDGGVHTAVWAQRQQA